MYCLLNDDNGPDKQNIQYISPGGVHNHIEHQIKNKPKQKMYHGHHRPRLQGVGRSRPCIIFTELTPKRD